MVVLVNIVPIVVIMTCIIGKGIVVYDVIGNGFVIENVWHVVMYVCLPLLRHLPYGVVDVVVDIVGIIIEASSPRIRKLCLKGGNVFLLDWKMYIRWVPGRDRMDGKLGLDRWGLSFGGCFVDCFDF
jgi:hypothetical protein